MSNPRYLTKSRFKLAVECPTKLFYTGKEDAYADTNRVNATLQALADGGFQVGELAKVMFPGGIEIDGKTHQEQLDQTRLLLERDDVTLFEAAICDGDLFARVDVLRKKGNMVELIEVKAKSFDSTDPFAIRSKRGGIDTGFLPYLQDVAFQAYLFGLAFPQLQVSSYLMMPDKAKPCTVNGLNQRFKIHRNGGQPRVEVAPGTDLSSIGEPILKLVNVDEFVAEILLQPIQVPGQSGLLADLTKSWAQSYRDDKKIAPTRESIGNQCAKCQFRTEPGNAALRNGLHECWAEAANLTAQDFSDGTVLDLWNFTGKEKLIREGILKLKDVPKEALKFTEAGDGLTRSQRQWMQISGKWPGRSAFYFDAKLVSREMATWTFPLHFIDFETARAPVPFFAGQHPYDNIAFQFSHHTVDKDYRVEHRSQYLDSKPGKAQNYEFVRQLKLALGSTGTVFMWSPHENTTLNAILDQLNEDPAPPTDADELASFISSLTYRTDGSVGHRVMVDLCKLSEKAFFHPSTSGRSSIKVVLPAVLQSSDYLKQRYSQRIYGTTDGIPSKNFSNWTWWRDENNGQATNPYSLLERVFGDLTKEESERLTSDDGDKMKIAEGGAAGMAYVRLQVDSMAATEKQAIESALLRYCELDTLAMVMVFEAWHSWTVTERCELREHYVYELRDHSGDTPRVIYVGKGVGDRKSQHVNEAKQLSKNDLSNSRENIPSKKLVQISDILEDGGNVLELVIGRFDTDAEAKAVEATLLHWVYGIDELTNIASGRHSDSIRKRGDYSERANLDMPRIVGLRDGAYTNALICHLESNNIPEAVKELQDNLQKEFADKIEFVANEVLPHAGGVRSSLGIAYNEFMYLQISLSAKGQKVVVRRMPGIANFAEKNFYNALVGSSRLGVTHADFATLKDLRGENRRVEPSNFESLVLWLNDTAEALRDIAQEARASDFPIFPLKRINQQPSCAL